MTMIKPNKILNNFFGAFADGAILFPLLVALANSTNASVALLLATSGLAYLIAAFLFRVPMSIQPLKSIAIAGLALGASSYEIRISAAIIGLFCLLITLFHVNELASKVPESLIHGLQLALGILLIIQGIKYAPVVADFLSIFILASLTFVVILSSYSFKNLHYTTRYKFPLLGLVATGGLIHAVFFTHPQALPSSGSTNDLIRIQTLASLIFPQLALTLANSVLATHNVAHRYFGAGASRVTIKRLLQSIGIGNLLSALVGGLPFCHGSGGLTAHVRGGATHWISNVFIGAALLFLALTFKFIGSVSFQYPQILLSCLLITTGVFHMGLAQPTWEKFVGKLQLITMGIVAVISQNMLYVLICGVLTEILMKYFFMQKKLESIQ